MIFSNAPNVTARRILIAVLAFAMAAAFVLVSAVAPADARDKKEFSADVDPDTVNAGSTSIDFLVTFTNETFETITQRAGAFRIDFDDFTVTDVSDPKARDAGGTVIASLDWNELWSSGSVVDITAASGGDRIRVGEKVTVVVTADVPTSAGTREFETWGDQEAGGNFNGGTKFDRPPNGGHPEVTVVSVAVPCGDFCSPVDPEGQWTSTLDCPEEDCFYVINDEAVGDVADITVSFDPSGPEGAIIIVMTTTGRGPSPGKAEVETEAGKILPDCGISPPFSNCVHINRVKIDGSQHTQYTVFWSGDPNFKFR